MNIKKNITLVLLSSVLLMILCFPVSAGTDTINSEEISLLSVLEIVDKPTEAAFLDQNVLRADFAVYVGKLIGVNESNVVNKRFFTDVPLDHWAVNTINTLTERGIISGSDGKFMPDDYISCTEAVSMLLNAVGYGQMAAEEGGYPNGYMLVASRYGIDVKISDYTKITFAEACGLIYDTLFLPSMQTKVMYNDGYAVEIDKDVNLLASLFDVYLVKGVVTSAFGVSSNSNNACGINKIRIDDTVYDNSFHNAMDFLGIKVRAYYRSINNENEIFYMCGYSDFDCFKLDIQDFEGFDENKYELSYSRGGKDTVKKKLIERNVTVVKNGVNVSSDIKGAFENLNDGTIVLSSSGGSEHFDTVIIKNYENVVVSSFNKNAMNIYDRIKKDNKVSLEGMNYLRISDRNGNEKSAGDIVQNMTLSVCVSDAFCEIIISEETVTGTITQIRPDDKSVYVSVDGTEYEVSKNFYNDNQKAFVIGRQIKLYINAFNKGAWAEFYSSDGYSCGYIIKTYTDKRNESFGIKVLTGSGNIEKLFFAQKSRVNQIMCRNVGEISSNLESRTGKSSGQVVVYKQNENGEITALETAAAYGTRTADVNLWVDKPLHSAYYYSSANMMGESIIIGDSSVCFKVPGRITTSTTDEDYSVVKISTLPEKTNYDVEAYKTGDDKLTADILLIKSDLTNGGWFHNMVVVDDIYEVYSEEKEEIETVADMWVCGNKITYRAVRTASFDEMPQFFTGTKIKLHKGDVIRIFLNSEGEITNADRFYSAETDEPNQEMNSHNDWSWEIYFASGYITDIKEDIARFEYKKDGESKTGLAKTAGAPILVYNTAKNKIIAGTASDLDEAMNENSLVYFGQNFGTTQQIYIIK